ncbi:hypothetical protein P3342_008817 [Pyrenophora teres f. teres]|nr:hypothetical protein P3342_008817 [Pyrenophora teres f. teres]
MTGLQNHKDVFESQTPQLLLVTQIVLLTQYYQCRYPSLYRLCKAIVVIHYPSVPDYRYNRTYMPGMLPHLPFPQCLRNDLAPSNSFLPITRHYEISALKELKYPLPCCIFIATRLEEFLLCRCEARRPN